MDTIVFFGFAFLLMVRLVQRAIFQSDAAALGDHEPFVDFDKRLVDVPTPDITVH